MNQVLTMHVSFEDERAGGDLGVDLHRRSEGLQGLEGRHRTRGQQDANSEGCASEDALPPGASRRIWEALADARPVVAG